MKRETRDYKDVVACLIVAVLLAFLFVPACFAVDVAEASGAIDQAESDLGSAYDKVAEAVLAGADVSALLSRLGGAGDFLSGAYVAFEAGDYGNAVSLALECSHAVKGVAEEAAGLKAGAERAHSESLLSAVAESGVGLGLLLVLGFVGWRLLRRRYFRRVLDMKPDMGEAR